MTEKEKMLCGKPYVSTDEELTKERLFAKELLYEYNLTRPNEALKREEIIKKLFGKTKNEFYIEYPFRCDYGYNIIIGEKFYANYNCTILDCAKVEIGDRVLFAPNVSLYTAGHPLHFELRKKDLEYAFPIKIGNDVWIGGNTVINPGVTIGDNSVIGSGSVVTKNIPANVVAAGNPCRVIKYITDKDKEKYYKELKV